MILRTITDESTGAVKSIGLFGKTLNGLKSSFANIKTNGLLNSIFKTSSIDTKAIDAYNKAITEATKNNVSMADKQQIMQTAMKGTNKETARLIQSTQGNIVKQEQLKAAQDATTLSAKAGQVALKGLAIAGNMLFSMGIGLAISAVVSGISYLVNAADIAKEKADGFANSLKQSNNNISSNSKEINNLNAKYQEYSKGVSALGHNISLTNEQYEDYKNIISKLSEIMPDLAVYHNAQGEAIGFEKGKLSELNKEYEKYQQNEAKKFFSEGDKEGNTFGKVLENYQNANLNNEMDYWSREGGLLKSAFGGNAMDDVYTAKGAVQNLKYVLSLTKDELIKVYKKKEDQYDLIDNLLPGLTPDTDVFQDLLLGKELSEIKEMSTEEFTEFQEMLAGQLQKYTNILDTNRENLKVSISKLLATYDEFYNIEPEKRDYLNAFINNILSDTFIVEQFTNEDGEILEEKIRAFISNILKKATDGTNGEKIQLYLKDLFTLSDKDIPYKEYIDKVNQIINTLKTEFGLSDEDFLDIKIKLGLDDKDSTSLVDKAKTHVKDALGEHVDEEEKKTSTFQNKQKKAEDWVDTLSKEDLEFVVKIVAPDVESFEKEVKRLKEKAAKEEIEIRGFKISDYKDKIDDAQKKIQDLDKIIENISFDKIDSSTIVDLMQDFPGLEEKIKSVVDQNFNLKDALANLNPENIFKIKQGLEELKSDSLKKTIEDLNLVKDALKDQNKDTSFIETLISQLNGLSENANMYVESASDIMNNFQNQYNQLISAQEELKENGALSLSTISNIINSGLGEYLEYTEGGLRINSAAFLENADTAKHAALMNIYMAMAEDMNALAAGDVDSVSSGAKTAIENMGNAAQEAGNKAEIAAKQWLEYAQEATKAALAAAQGDPNLLNKINTVKDYYNGLINSINNTNFAKSASVGAGTKDKKSKSGGSAKEHETNDEYYNFFQAKIEDYKNGADKLKKAIEETNEQIELAYKTGDTKLAKSLEAMLPQQTQKYKDYLAANAEAMRKMAKEEIYPIVYQIAPELKGKTIDQFSEEDKLKIKERLDNAIIEQKNKVIDLENAQKDSDNKTKVSDADVKNAEKQLKILEELYSTLEKSYELVGNKAGEGEWSKNYREMINDQIDAIKDSLDKAIDQDEFNLSLFEGMDNQEGMLNVYLQELDKYRKAVKDLKALGLSENSSEIQEQQKKYRETFEKIFELGKDVFEKLKKKREDALDTVEFKFDMTGEKEYEKQIELLNDETAIHQDNVNKIIERMNDLEERYRNNSIVAAEYEEEIRSLNEELKEEVQNLKSIAEQRRDIEISKLDDQIDDLTRATEKQTKAIDEKVDALEKESDELDKLKNLYDKAYSAIQKVVDDQIEELNDLKEQEEEYWDEKLEALEKINEETTRGIELSEKQKAIEEARQRTALVYHEDKGWVHEANPNDLSAAQQDLDQWLIDDQFEQAKKSIEEQKEASLNAIEEQIEAWDKYIEKWEDAVNAYEDGQDRIAASTVIGANWEKSTLAQREDIIRKFETNYSALLKQLDEDNKNSIENQIEELNKQKEAIEKASDAQIEKLNNLKSAYEELFNNLSEDSVKWVESIIEKWDLDISVKEDLLKLLKTRKDELLNAKAEAEKPLAYNNDIVTIIKQMMGYSQKWSEAITQQDKDQLHEKNVGLADELNRKGLKVHFDNEKYSWFDENGNAIYSDEFLEKLVGNTVNTIKEANEILEREYQKISDWGLDKYANAIKNGTIQSIFGNVDMDKRTIIQWSDELKQTYKDVLASWEYDPDIGSIDTVFGSSSRFGEDLNGNGWEIAFTPILPDGTFLSKYTVYNYIEGILKDAYINDGKVTENELKKLDLQGRQIGNVFVKGIFAGIDDSLNYDNNGNWAETVGRLMHFSGDFGAIKLANDEVQKATEENSEVIKDDTQAKNNVLKQTKNLNTNLSKTNTAIQDMANAAESLTDALNNKSSSNSSSSGSTNSSSESSSSSSSDTITYPTDGTPYTYSSTLTGEDIETAAKWFEDNHKTNPGTDIKVIHGGVSTLSTDLINQLGLASGDLVALGKQLYYITGSGYSKITGSLVNKYAKGSKYIPYDQIALVNEEGDELIASKNSQGDITKLRKGDEVVPAKDTQTLMSLVDWVNDPNNANDPKYEEFSNILAMQKKFMDYLSNNSNSFDTIATIKNNKLLNDLSKGNILNNITTNNNNGMVNHNYNIQKVELNKADNAEDLFRGIENLARQRSMRR